MLYVYAYRLYGIVMHIVFPFFLSQFALDSCDAAQQRPLAGLDSLSFFFTAEIRENAELSVTKDFNSRTFF